MQRVSLILGVVMTAVVIAFAAISPALLDRAREAVFDGYQRLSPRAYDPAVPVHVIDIDEAALSAYGQWPWPRSYLATLTERLFDHGASVVGYDILFPEPDRTSPERIVESWSRFSQAIPPALPDLGVPPHDSQFAAAIEGRAVVLSVAGGADGAVPAPKAGIAVTGALPSALVQFEGAIGNLPELTQAAAGLGTIILARDGDGITRSVPMVSLLDGQPFPALSAEVLRVAQGAGGFVLRTSEASGERSGGTQAAVALRVGALTVPVDADAGFRLHFAGPQPARVTPVGAILEADGISPDLQARLSGRIVLVGSSAQGLFDLRTTPLVAQVAGVTLHAEAIEQILGGQFLTRPDWMRGLEFLLTAVVGIALSLLQWRGRVWSGLILALAAVLGALGAGATAFAQLGLLFDPIAPILVVLAVYLPGTTLVVIAKDNARRAIRQRFAYFLPPDLIDQVAANPDQALTPGGAARDLTVMFVDMRGFSTVTEGMPPDQVVDLVNTYLSEVSDALVGEGATIDKFMGDAAMAFWNAPIARPDHAQAAIRAIGPVEDALDRATRRLGGAHAPIRVGIGINTGPASVGLMGSHQRLSYTCIGDSVTLAARLEGLTRVYGVGNCVGATTAEAVPDGLRAVPLDLIAVKGFRTPLSVSVIVPAGADGLDDFTAALADARALYLARDWAGATEAFEDLAAREVPFCQTDRLAQVYLDRIEGFYRTPPPDHWDGSATADQKR